MRISSGAYVISNEFKQLLLKDISKRIRPYMINQKKAIELSAANTFEGRLDLSSWHENGSFQGIYGERKCLYRAGIYFSCPSKKFIHAFMEPNLQLLINNIRCDMKILPNSKTKHGSIWQSRTKSAYFFLYNSAYFAAFTMNVELIVTVSEMYVGNQLQKTLELHEICLEPDICADTKRNIIRIAKDVCPSMYTKLEYILPSGKIDIWFNCGRFNDGDTFDISKK